MKDFNFKLDIVKSLEKVKSGDRVIIGYASTFDVDSDDTQITREALEGAKDDLLTYSTVLFNHDMDKPIGKVVDTEVDDVGLLIKVVLSKEEDEMWKKIKEGILSKFSIRGRVLEMRDVEGKETTLRQITKIKLFEVSLVTVPANKEAQSISHWVAKTLSEPTKDLPTLVKKAEEELEVSEEEVVEVETSYNNKKNMDELLKKLKVILSKEKAEDIRNELSELIKNIETEEDLIAKLETVAGKLSGEDKEIVDIAIASLNKRLSATKELEENDMSDTVKNFDLNDESETRPVFQLNGEESDIELEDNKFKKQVLKFGKWFHWDADGGVLNITEEVVDNIIKNFKKGFIDHVYVPLSHTNDPSKNAGEVVELKKTNTGLDAIIEVKDETIAEKIKKGLIRCVSASLDPNYRVKTSNKFVGPTLLHTALVAEPFIKGMGKFVALSDDFDNRNVIQLEDQEPNFFAIMKALKESLEKIESKVVTSDEIAEVFAKLNTAADTVKSEEADEAATETEDTEEVVEENEEGGDEGGEVAEESEEESEEVVKAKHTHKEGDPCKNDGKKGKYVKEGDELVCKLLTAKELDELKKTKFQSCMSKEMKAGKTMAEAAKICKADTNKKIEKMYSEETSGEKPEEESEDTAQLDFADAEKEYEKYLNQGKIVPAQKEAFIKLMASTKNLELGDDTVGVSKLIEAFMESQASSIDFDENGVEVDEENTDADEGNSEDNTSDIPAEAKDLFSKMGLSDEDMKSSWKNLQEMKKEDDEEKSSLFN